MKNRDIIINIIVEFLALMVQTVTIIILAPVMGVSDTTTFYIILASCILCIVSWCLLYFEENKAINTIRNIIIFTSLPLVSLLYIIFNVFWSVVHVLIISGIFICIISTITSLCSYAISKYIYPLTNDTIVYIVLTFTTIFYANFGEKPIKILSKIWMIGETKKMLFAPYDKKTIKWIISFVYFLAFLISSFRALNFEDYFLANVVIKAFATWVAFDRFFDSEITKNLNFKIPLLYIKNELESKDEKSQ